MNTIDQIEFIRLRNNKNWMDLLKLALKYSPSNEIKPVLQGIVERDIEVIDTMKQLLEELK